MAENWRGVWVVAYRELLRFVRDRSRLVSSFAFPLLFLVIFGAGFSQTMGALAPGVDFVQFMYPGILAMTVLTTSLFAGISVVWDREFGFLKEVLVAPMGRTGIVVGKAFGAVVVAGIQVGIMLVLAPIVGVPLDLVAIAALVPIVVILSLGLAGLGILVASFMRSQQGFQLLIQIIIFPLIFLAGVFFPVNAVPVWLEVISKLNPLTYGVDAIRQVLLGPEAAQAGLGVTVFGHTMTVVEDVLVVAALGSVLLGAAVWAFRRQE
ncbi:MAG TPA: ABC transporter permease [Candidatus Limnocylindrales bacterium]|nr:ABC transporter permease [Candidatus Limnocylindrales bacterium]